MELIDVIVALETVNLLIQEEQKSPAETALYDKRGLAIAITHLETAMLWLANSAK